MLRASRTGLRPLHVVGVGHARVQHISWTPILARNLTGKTGRAGKAGRMSLLSRVDIHCCGSTTPLQSAAPLLASKLVRGQPAWQEHHDVPPNPIRGRMHALRSHRKPTADEYRAFVEELYTHPRAHIRVEPAKLPISRATRRNRRSKAKQSPTEPVHKPNPNLILELVKDRSAVNRRASTWIPTGKATARIGSSSADTASCKITTPPHPYKSTLAAESAVGKQVARPRKAPLATPTTENQSNTCEDDEELQDNEYLSAFEELHAYPPAPLQFSHVKLPPLRPITRRRRHVRYTMKHDTEQTDPSQSLIAELVPKESEAVRDEWLELLGSTTDLDEAWTSYQTLVDLPLDTFPLVQPKPNGPAFQIPHRYLHRFAGMLASTRPKTKEVYRRLHTVLMTIQDTGGTIHLWEWNALIHLAGNGYRKLLASEVQLSLDLLQDLIERLPVGTTTERRKGHGFDELTPSSAAVRLMGPKGPDIITYTALLDLAVRTQHIPLVRHVRGLLLSSNIQPNAITHRVMLRHFTRTRDMSGVRETLSRMRAQKMELGKEGVNAALWAFAYNGHLSEADAIYHVLRASLKRRLAETDLPQLAEAVTIPEPKEQGIDQTRRHLLEHENIHIPDDLIPDAYTYTALILSFAYHGHLVPALRVFHDMLTTPDIAPVIASYEVAARQQQKKKKKSSDVSVVADQSAISKALLAAPTFAPTYVVYRAIFLGFARYVLPQYTPRGQRSATSHALGVMLRGPRRRHAWSPAAKAAAAEEGWTLAQLELFFSSFLALPANVRPKTGTIYWILVAYERATDGDVKELRRVYGLLERRFGGPWKGRLGRIREALVASEQDEKQWERNSDASML
jgi:hypothetical protein